MFREGYTFGVELAIGLVDIVQPWKLKSIYNINSNLHQWNAHIHKCMIY